MAVQHLGYIFRFRNELGNVLDDDLALVVWVKYLCLHHAGAYRCHLRTVFGVDDGCHDITAKGRADLVEKAVVVLAQFLVVVGTYLQSGAVGGKTAVQSTAHAWAKVAAYHVGTHQANLRLLLAEQVNEHCRMRLAGVGAQSLCIKDVQTVHAVRQDLLLHLACYAASGNHSLQLYTQGVCQFTALGKQFLAHFGNTCAFYLAIYEYVVHILCPSFSYPMV